MSQAVQHKKILEQDGYFKDAVGYRVEMRKRDWSQRNLALVHICI
jgi:hypothetical protein